MPETDFEDQIEAPEYTPEEKLITRIPDDEYPAVPDLAPTPETPFESSKSSVKASKKDHRQAVGPNTKATRTGPPGSLPEHLIPVPDPKYKIYISDNPNPNQRSKSFYSWWNLLPGEFQNRTIAYVYREWPVLLPVPLGEDGEKTDNSYIDKISGTEPLQDDIDLADKYGSGDYKIFFNEAGTKFKRTLATIYIRGTRDLKSRPPADSRISDVGNVDMNDPQNKSYIEYLRGRGLLPEQSRNVERQETVATIEAVKEVTQQYGQLVNRMMDEKSSGGGFDREVMAGVMDVVKDSVKTANEITAKSVDRANEILDGARQQVPAGSGNNGSGRDPLEIAVQIVQLMKQGDSSTEVSELRRELADSNNKRLEFLERQLTESRAATAPAAASGPFGTVEAGVKALRSMREVVQEFSGESSGRERDNPVEEAVGDMAPKWLRPFLPIAMAVAQGFFQSRQQMQGQPQQPPISNPGPGGIPPYQPQPAQQQIPGPQLVPNNAQPQAQPGPQASPTMDPEMAEVLTSMAIPLGNYIHDDQTDGEAFAGMVYNVYGRFVYDIIKQAGEAAVLQTITTFPPMAKRIADVPRVRVETFVREFVNAKIEDGDGEEEETATGVAPTVA